MRPVQVGARRRVGMVGEDGAEIGQGYGEERTIIRMLYPKLYKGIYTKLYD